VSLVLLFILLSKIMEMGVVEMVVVVAMAVGVAGHLLVLVVDFQVVVHLVVAGHRALGNLFLCSACKIGYK
jgi:hypothetical protein